MTERTRALLAEVLKLPAAERASLIAEVAAHLDDEEATFDPEWLAELERRAHAARSDRTGSSLEEIEARLAQRLRRE
jgi:putative addiction module component (TIGR02574 family)